MAQKILVFLIIFPRFVGFFRTFIAVGAYFKNTTSQYQYAGQDIQHTSVLDLALNVLRPLLKGGYSPVTFITATTCPDSLAPSLGQKISKEFPLQLEGSHIFDLVQGCAGGVSALILGSEIAQSKGKPVLIVSADAAHQAVSASSPHRDIFGNGAFAVLIDQDDSEKGLLYSMTRRYSELVDVVSLNLGHDAADIIRTEEGISKDPHWFLGLQMDKKMAVLLLQKSLAFFQEFVDNSSMPDVLILHQANPSIVEALTKRFKDFPLKMVQTSHITGNCGTATTGLALDYVKDTLPGKKVMICSYGTGGVISAGMWQM